MRTFLVASLLILAALDAGLLAGELFRLRAEPAFHAAVWRA